MSRGHSKGTVPLWKRKYLVIPVLSLVALLAIGIIAFTVSPWPGALVIRSEFQKGGEQVKEALDKHEPSVPVAEIKNQQYLHGEKDALFDVFYPESLQPGKTLPTIVWTHGGAWISGSKDLYTSYFKELATYGFTVVALNYSYGPERTYPTSFHQLNTALAYLSENAGSLHIDSNNIALAGDSAGSQLSSQLAVLITNPEYATKVGLTPGLAKDQLKAVILNCGIYDIPKLDLAITSSELVNWGNHTALWAYTGEHDVVDSAAADEMSSIRYVTRAFPATFITGGNADPLTDAQSKPFAEKLTSLGVPVQDLFYSKDHQPALPHEYQFNLDTEDGVAALNTIADFAKKHLTD